MGAAVAGVWLATYPLDRHEGVTGWRLGRQIQLVHLALDVGEDVVDEYEIEEPVARRIPVPRPCNR